ncbi:MAG TPA: glycosyltransferase family 39 protein [Pyrinomonadaceae bacterium]|nr:glycosyltransferase family 39 protein [Pyrinomonadaceae bacterium]
MICLAIFLVAISVRLLLWQDNRPNLPRIFTGMVEHHKSNAHLLLKGDVTHFVNGPAPPGDANILTYPPGYPIIMAIIFRLFGDSDTAMRIFQIICDAAAAVLLFLVAAEVLPIKAAVVAGALDALSPQLAYYSLLLLPDSLATVPILLALYFIVRAKKFNSLRAVMAAGAFVGLSCWLRSNALLLAPFLAVVLLIVMPHRRRWPSAAALVAATILVIAPITIRNLVVFHHFIPLSLGAGQMLNVGIGDYDKERKFGLPGTDIETVTSEARAYDRPDYAGSLFGGNGIERDQERTKRGLAVVRSHPGWFAKVVLRRAVSMLRLERVSIVSRAPAPTHGLETAKQMAPVWSKEPTDFVATNATPTTSTISLAARGDAVRIESADLRKVSQIVSFPIAVERNSEYLFRLPVKVEQGNVVINIMSSNQEEALASTPVLHPLETSAAFGQPTFLVEIPFVNRNGDDVLVVISNDGPRPVQTIAQIGRMELFRLGAASLLWTKYLRLIIHVAQEFFLTAWMLPLALIGILLRKFAGHSRLLIILLAIPLYYLAAQSFLHTEYRYVMAIQHSLFVMVAATLYWFSATLLQLIRSLSARS